jgi:hypothetical protein
LRRQDAVLCAINSPEAIKKILDCLSLRSRLPPISAAVLGDPFNLTCAPDPTSFASMLKKEISANF